MCFSFADSPFFFACWVGRTALTNRSLLRVLPLRELGGSFLVRLKIPQRYVLFGCGLALFLLVGWIEPPSQIGACSAFYRFGNSEGV